MDFLLALQDPAAAQAAVDLATPMWVDILHHPVMRGAIAGALSAAHIDFQAFRSWKSFTDAYAYDWPIAAWRWFQGAVVGAATGFGLAGLTG